MKDQIIKIMETEDLTPGKFADEIGVQRSSISHIMSGRNKPSYDFIMKIVNRFQGINTEWLLTGKGSMIKSSGNISGNLLKQGSLFDQPMPESGREIIKPAENIKETQLSEKDRKIGNQPYDNSGTAGSTASDNIRSFQFTNVNNITGIFFFYSDGTFEKFNPRNSDIHK